MKTMTQIIQIISKDGQKDKKFIKIGKRWKLQIDYKNIW